MDELWRDLQEPMERPEPWPEPPYVDEMRQMAQDRMNECNDE